MANYPYKRPGTQLDDFRETIIEFQLAVEQDVRNVQGQVSKIVAEGDSSPLAAQAAIDMRGKAYKTLKERLDAEQKDFSTTAEGIQARFLETPTKSDVNAMVSKLADATPKFANSVSEMTDNTKVYVNLSDGFIYTYDGTKRVNTNLKYTSQELDTKAAALITEKVDPRAMEYNFLTNLNRVDLWEQGPIKDTGENSEPNSILYKYRIRTKTYIPNNIELLTCPNDVQMYMFRYRKDGTLVDNTGFIEKYSTFQHDVYNYRVQLSWKVNPATTEIKPDQAAKVLFLSNKNKFLEEKVDSDSARLGYTQQLNNAGVWEQGHLTDTGGESGRSDSLYYPIRLRTNTFIPDGIERILAKDGYQFSIYTFSKDGKFEGTTGAAWKTSFLPETTKKYKVVMRRKDDSPITNLEFDGVYFLNGKISIPKSLVMFEKILDFGSTNLTGWYEGQLDDYSLFHKETQTNDYYNAFNSLIDQYPGYATKTLLGKDSADTNDMYSYLLKPVQYIHKGIVNPIPKILIIAGQHGFEKNAVFGLYYFIKDMLENWDKSPILEYFRFHVEFEFIPLVNPYGFNKNEYKNGRGVNLNRAYPGTQWKLLEPDSIYYGGPEPFSEKENQYVKALIDRNQQALYFADFHTNGDDSVPLVKTNWHSLWSEGNDYYNRLFYAARHTLRNVTHHFDKQYNLGLDNSTITGYIDSGNGSPDSTKYAIANNILATTLEGFGGFEGRPPFTPDSKKANAELLGNWLTAIINQYKNGA